MKLFEQYRPRAWDELVGQDKARQTIDALRPRGLAGRSYWLSGPSGVGKTTIAYLIAREVADDFAIQEIDGTQVSADWLRELESTWHLSCLGTTRFGRAYVVNEAHGLSNMAVKRFLSLLEDHNMPRHVAFIFTTTKAGLTLFQDQQADAHPLLHRCTEIPLTSQGLAKPGAVRLLEIANAEKLRNGDSDAVLLKRLERIIHEGKGSLRKALNEIEKGALL